MIDRIKDILHDHPWRVVIGAAAVMLACICACAAAALFVLVPNAGGAAVKATQVTDDVGVALGGGLESPTPQLFTSPLPTASPLPFVSPTPTHVPPTATALPPPLPTNTPADVDYLPYVAVDTLPEGEGFYNLQLTAAQIEIVFMTTAETDGRAVPPERRKPLSWIQSECRKLGIIGNDWTLVPYKTGPDTVFIYVNGGASDPGRHGFISINGGICRSNNKGKCVTPRWQLSAPHLQWWRPVPLTSTPAP